MILEVIISFSSPLICPNLDFLPAQWMNIP